MIESISDYEISEAQKVLQAHTVPYVTRETALESAQFCIVSQALSWEKATKFIYSLRRESHPDSPDYRRRISSMDVLMNKELINQIEKDIGLRFHHNHRFDSIIDYFQNHLNIEDIERVTYANNEIRNEFDKEVKYLGRKTFSFWHLCMGGKNLIALDVHIMRNLAELDLDIPEEFYKPVKREEGSQAVRKTPNREKYIEIENMARKLFSNDPRFIYDGDKVDMALIDSVLWWKGAKRVRGDQRVLPGLGLEEYATLPYSESLLAE